MHLIDGRVVLSPTDLVGFLECEHLTQLELQVTRGQLVRATRDDPQLDLLSRLGEAHEITHRDRLAAERGPLVEIAQPVETIAGLQASADETLAAMRDGAGVIYQAAFFDGTWRGRADFLLRIDRPSVLGDWSYEVADTKLARRVKVAALLQMCEYSLQVERLQGVMPHAMRVILGSGVEEEHRVADSLAYHRAARKRLERTVLGAPVSTYPDPVDHCGVCRWKDRCVAQRRADDHLSIVAGMRRDHTRRLVSAGITTMATLAGAPEAAVPNIGEGPYERLRKQARLQVAERTTGEQSWEVVPVTGPGLGLAGLPAPSAGDLFFDMEGDPFVGEGGLEYLFGVTDVLDGAPRFRAYWAHNRAEEKLAFERFVDLVIARLDSHPDMHVYHYANYEERALKTLMGRHGTREDEVDRLLRGGVLVDLYRVVRQGIRVSKESYGLKALEAFYMEKRDEAIADAASSIVAYESWLTSRDGALLEEIERYNERDCDSTRMLREWLEVRRAELGAMTGHEVPRPEPESGAPSEKVARVSAETKELAAALTTGIAEEPTARTAAEAGRWLLAQLLDWHRREDKSAWWAYFDRRDMTDEDLVEDGESIGSIEHVADIGRLKRSDVHRYVFDPTQEHKLDVNDEPHDPRTRGRAGIIVAIDNEVGTVDLSRGPTFTGRPHPTSLIPATPIPADVMSGALQRLGSRVARHGIDADGPWRAIRDLLLQRPPRLADARGGALVAPDEDAVAATSQLVSNLAESCLAVQGPPGSGKTHTAAHVILDLVGQGRRVGVCATTHRAIGNLLEKIAALAAKSNAPVRLLQRCGEDKLCTAPGIRRAKSTSEVVTRLDDGEVDVVGGTAWLFSELDLEGRLDVLVIDEAGQMSLANACAVAGSARNLVLLGDPQQLAQPSRGIHPPGADRSALQHILDGHDTIASDRGVFLPTSWRMHPLICAFVSDAFYDGRLVSAPQCSGNRIGGVPGLAESGTQLIPVEHTGNRTWSAEEVAAVVELVCRLLRGRWSEAGRPEAPLTLDDILVVAPYNAQVRRLTDALPEGARVGTVDRFQGQEAAVSIYSAATSSADDVPRNLEFLFSRNRLNVAVSRAQALSIVVCSPQLFAVRCRTPEQLRLVNALCRYAETADRAAPGRAALALPLGAR